MHQYTREQLAELELLAFIAPPKILVTTEAVERVSVVPVLPKATERLAPEAPAKVDPQQAVPSALPVAKAPATHARSDAGVTAQATWDDLDGLTRDCKACGLCNGRKQAVLGVGSRAPGANPWLLVGEGPGADEDEQGEPFVGQAGKLLEAMLSAMGLKRGVDVYIANVVKCRPPNNRTPSLEEAAACAPFLDRQIALIQPKIIVALGRTAIVRLLGADTTMAQARGRRFEHAGIPLVATYHPSYLLRTPEEKRKAWDDLLFAKAVFAGQK
jgi:uracil-DNA glycosylase